MYAYQREVQERHIQAEQCRRQKAGRGCARASEAQLLEARLAQTAPQTESQMAPHNAFKVVTGRKLKVGFAPAEENRDADSAECERLYQKRTLSEENFIGIAEQRNVEKKVHKMIAGMPMEGSRSPSPVEKRVPRNAKSRITKAGTYLPGEDGCVAGREYNAYRLFDDYPDLRRLFEKHKASKQYQDKQLLRYEDKLTDGFRARFSKEILLVNAHVDPALQEFMEWLKRRVENKGGDTLQRVRTIMRLVCQAFGGSDARTVHWKARIEELRMFPPEDLPIGELMGGFGNRRPGAGVCRHRAILMKYACDCLGIAPCALVNGVVAPAGMTELIRKADEGAVVQRAGDHMWNVVSVKGRSYLVDCMLEPSKMLTTEVLERFCTKYHRQNGREGLKSLALNSSCRRRSFDTLTQGSTPDDWLAMQKDTMEQLGEVEVLTGPQSKPSSCDHCGGTIDGMLIRLLRCGHVFHNYCLLENWVAGCCPLCQTSFAPVLKEQDARCSGSSSDSEEWDSTYAPPPRQVHQRARRQCYGNDDEDDDETSCSEVWDGSCAP